MYIAVTLKEVNSKGFWNKFCEITGVNYYCLNDGADENAIYKLTLEQAKECGLI